MEPKVAKTMAEWGYRGPGQAEPGGCARCGAACCTTVWDEGDGLYYCVGRCDANAVHPPPGSFDAATPGPGSPAPLAHQWEVRGVPGKKAYRQCVVCLIQTDLLFAPDHPCPGGVVYGPARWLLEGGVVTQERGAYPMADPRSALDRIDPYEVRIRKEMGEWQPTPEALARAIHRATMEQAVFFNMSVPPRHFDLLDELQRRMLIAVAADVIARWDEICAVGAEGER